MAFSSWRSPAHRCWLGVLLVLGNGGACHPPPARQAGEEISVPFRIIASFGQRPSLEAQLNGYPVRFVLHSNAGFVMQISHATAQAAHLANLTHTGSYGIAAQGQVSSLGRDTARVQALTIGGHVFARVPVDVFETPNPPDQGMLGLPWLRQHRAVLDYGHQRVYLDAGAAATQTRVQALRRQGYQAVPLQVARNGRYQVTVTIQGVASPLTISTVADNLLDSTFARRVGIALRKTGGVEGGPTGTTVPEYKSQQPVTIQLQGVSYVLPPVTVFNLAAYDGQPRRAAGPVNVGDLGADFLLATAAVVDFGNQVLYLKKQ